jgi:hypothetical protein
MWKNKSPTLTDANRQVATQIWDLSKTYDNKGSYNSTNKQAFDQEFFGECR